MCENYVPKYKIWINWNFDFEIFYVIFEIYSYFVSLCVRIIKQVMKFYDIFSNYIRLSLVS